MTESLDFYQAQRQFTAHIYHSQQSFKAVPTGNTISGTFIPYVNCGRGNIFVGKQVNCTEY